MTVYIASINFKSVDFNKTTQVQICMAMNKFVVFAELLNLMKF